MNKTVDIKFLSDSILLKIPYDFIEQVELNRFLKILKVESFINKLSISENIVEKMKNETNERIREEMKEYFKDAKNRH